MLQCELCQETRRAKVTILVRKTRSVSTKFDQTWVLELLSVQDLIIKEESEFLFMILVCVMPAEPVLPAY